MPEIPSVTKVWGEERWIVNDAYCGKLLKLKRLHQCSIHYHKIKDETFFILSGSVVLEINNEVYVLIYGDSIRIKPGEKHRFTGIKDSEIIEFSSHHEDSDSYRDTKSKSITQLELASLLAKAIVNIRSERVNKVYDFSGGGIDQ